MSLLRHFPAPDNLVLGNRELDANSVKTAGHRPQHQSSSSYRRRNELPRIRKPRIVQVADYEAVISFVPDTFKEVLNSP